MPYPPAPSPNRRGGGRGEGIHCNIEMFPKHFAHVDCVSPRSPAAWLRVATVNFTPGETPEAVMIGCPPGRIGLVSVPCRSGTSMRASYERLRAAGKLVKVARCAAARKLLHLAWALVTKGQHFDPPALSLASCHDPLTTNPVSLGRTGVRVTSPHHTREICVGGCVAGRA